MIQEHVRFHPALSALKALTCWLPSCSLLSQGTYLLVVPRSNIVFGSREFRVAALAILDSSEFRPGHDVRLHPHFHCDW